MLFDIILYWYMFHSVAGDVIFTGTTHCFPTDLMKLESIWMKCLRRSIAGVKMLYFVMLWFVCC